MDTSINDGAIISRKCKRKEFKKIIMIVVAYVIYMFMSLVAWNVVISLIIFIEGQYKLY